MKITPPLLVLLALLRPLDAWGCDTQATATTSSTCITSTREGKVWVSYPADTAVSLVKARDALPASQAEAAALRRAVSDMLAQRDMYVSALAKRQVALDEADKVAAAAAARADESHPVRWFLGGTAVGAIVIAAIAYAIK